MLEVCRLHVLFKGTVQGVGFRFLTERVAQRFGLVGFVRNLASGDVEVVAEGSRKTLDEFLEAIQSGSLSGYITAIDKSWGPPTGEFEDFGIRF
ncbi:MAG: acylphosphatase [Candidatus Ratteibacteria bacterium]|nr:acylphosphatase [Candidatus Ratteibacteria bacterium]